MATELKYIRHKTLGFVLWPNSEGGEARCWGRSESLKLDSQPREDSAALARQLGLTP